MDILGVLREEKELLGKMLKILNKEKEILIRNDVVELQKVVEEKEELKKVIDQVEDRRHNLCGGRRLKEILPELDGKEREEIEKTGSQMEEIVHSIQEANNTNNLLLKQSLNYIRTVVNLLTPVNPSIYGADGRVEDSKVKVNMLDKSV